MIESDGIRLDAQMTLAAASGVAATGGTYPSRRIRLTSLPAQALPSASGFVAESYSVRIWRDGGTDYLAISDIDRAELAKFCQLFDALAKPGPNKSG
ncbi:MAG: hypothetical protein DLM68_09190 [Hyphomicrobiales bacterium]|nr:MAG: hypothetical protein DLM68_09190 [Hyphomicrobiales bacterium]